MLYPRTAGYLRESVVYGGRCHDHGKGNCKTIFQVGGVVDIDLRIGLLGAGFIDHNPCIREGRTGPL